MSAEPVHAFGHPRPYTSDEVLSWPDDNTPHELIDGTLFVSPHASVRHQLALERLREVLRPWLPPGWLMIGPVNLRVSDSTLLVPDLVVVDRVDQDALAAEPGDVRLVVEVVSPSSRKLDRLLKPAVYAEAGIGAYWRIELEPRPAVHVYALEGGSYRLAAAPFAGEVLAEREPFRVRFDPAVLTGKTAP